MPRRASGFVVARRERHSDHRTALGEDGRDSSDQSQGSQDHSSLGGVSRSEQRSRGHWTEPWRRNGECRHRPDLSAVPDGMGHRQGLRSLSPRHRQAARARREDRLGSAHPRGRRRDHRRNRNRSLVLPERSGAEAPQLPRALHRHRQFEASRHSAEHDHRHRGLHGVEGQHAHHQLPAALPSARQVDAGRGDSADRPAPDRQLRLRTSTSTG